MGLSKLNDLKRHLTPLKRDLDNNSKPSTAVSPSFNSTRTLRPEYMLAAGLVKQDFKTAIMALFGLEMEPEIFIINNPTLGDIQICFAMRLANRLDSDPIEIARNVLAQVDINPYALFANVMAGGYINLKFADI